MPFPTEEKFIVSAETELGVRLPAPLRVHLLVSNGGEIETADDVWQIFPVLDISDHKRASRSTSHIVYETRVAREWARFPQDAVAIAVNGTGDRLVLFPSEDDPHLLDAQVFHWDHETGTLSIVAAFFGAP